MGAALEIEDDGNFFDVMTLGKVTILFGDKFAFAVMNPQTNIAVLEGTEMFDALGNTPAITFHASYAVDIPKKDYPNLNLHNLKDAFDFGFVQGLRQSTAVAEYWGEQANHGRSFFNIPMPGTMEVDTADPIKPFTMIAAKRFSAKPASTTKAGFHAFRVQSKFGDGPLWRFAHTVDVRPDSTFMLPVKHYLRRITSNRFFVTIFCAREKSTGDFTAISATEWQIRHDHTVSYVAKSDGKLERTVSGSDGQFPSGGNPAAIGPAHRAVLAMAKAGSPFTTPETLRQRASEGGLTMEAKNPDFDAGFWKKG